MEHESQGRTSLPTCFSIEVLAVKKEVNQDVVLGCRNREVTWTERRQFIKGFHSDLIFFKHAKEYVTVHRSIHRFGQGIASPNGILNDVPPTGVQNLKLL